MVSSLGDFYCSGFPKTYILETTYHLIKKVTNRPENWKHIMKYLKKNYPNKKYNRVEALKSKLKNKLRRKN